MTIIISAEKDGYTHEATGETLEELRKRLIDEAIDSDNIMDDWLDQVEAVYPRDESELDYDEEPLTPRPLTEELLDELACHVWDVPSISWQTSHDMPQPTTRGQLQATQHYLGLSLTDLAVKLNVTERTIRRWVGGTSPIPGGVALELRQLVEAFEDDVDEITARAERPASITIYPEDKEEQQLPLRPLGWERRVLQEAMIRDGVELLLEDEA
ncbi:helix-turn-helix domain-containing protein [Corynebacterium sp. 11254D000AR]